MSVYKPVGDSALSGSADDSGRGRLITAAILTGECFFVRLDGPDCIGSGQASQPTKQGAVVADRDGGAVVSPCDWFPTLRARFFVVLGLTKVWHLWQKRILVCTPAKSISRAGDRSSRYQGLRGILLFPKFG